uniref:Uncharacterized protein n=1 Tax=Fagus sylvatica TaxID=28930 RepID=A0A2N9ENH0_FAGSY
MKIQTRINIELDRSRWRLGYMRGFPLTPEEVSVREILKPRSGYVKGLGIRPSSSLRTIASSGMSRDDVQRQIAEIKEAANSEIAELKEANKRHEEMTANIRVLRSQSFTTPLRSQGAFSTRGDGLSWEFKLGGSSSFRGVSWQYLL